MFEGAVGLQEANHEPAQCHSQNPAQHQYGYPNGRGQITGSQQCRKPDEQEPEVQRQRFPVPGGPSADRKGGWLGAVGQRSSGSIDTLAHPLKPTPDTLVNVAGSGSARLDRSQEYRLALPPLAAGG